MKDLFTNRLAPYVGDVRAYCMKLTGSPWDADDLLQETMTRAYRAFLQEPDRPLQKAYLLRIAKTAWIDNWRKKAPDTEPIAEEVPQVDRSGMVREAFEVLAERLSARHLVLVLLIDVFQFTARETAELLHLTEGAVKEGIKRARGRLERFAQDSQQTVARRKGAPTEPLTRGALEAFLTAFRAGHPEQICATYRTLVQSGVQVVQVARLADRLSFTFRDPDGHLIRIFSEISS